MAFPGSRNEDPIVLSDRLFSVAARIETMQRPPSPSDAYRAEEIVMLAHLDTEAYEDLKAKAAAVNSRSGKASRASSESGSPTSSPEGSSTPNP
jgi:hypothetical protein